MICTDKTGTLTENRMRVTQIWLPGADVDGTVPIDDRRAVLLAATAAACTTADRPTSEEVAGRGDPTELALLRWADDLRVGGGAAGRGSSRRAIFHFDSHLERMTTVDEEGGDPGSAVPAAIAVHTKGAAETVLPCCSGVRQPDGSTGPLDDPALRQLHTTLDRLAAHGLRVLVIARRVLDPDEPVPTGRAAAETGLVLIGLVGMVDPPRSGVADAVARAHVAGLRIHVVTGDYGLSAAEIAHQVGIGAVGGPIIAGNELDAMSSSRLNEVLSAGDEIIFARSSPEGKLRIAEALHALGDVVAMTGDGVNDAPALRAADIGVAMGRSGTDVAREAATIVLTDDNFATIVAAIEAGRRVFDNVRKFVLYIFAHAIPEVVPFLVFALSGGRIPLPLTVLQILAIDLGTETLPALALGREPAEPGLMSRPPRPRGTGVIDRVLLLRAWGLLGATSAVLVMSGFLYTLSRAGWYLGAPTGTGTPLHHGYLQATSITFAGIVTCQIGTAFAARTDHASLFTIGLRSNPLLLWGIAFELVFTAAVIYLPPLQHIFGTAGLGLSQLVVLVPFPIVVWGVDEFARWVHRRRG